MDSSDLALLVTLGAVDATASRLEDIIVAAQSIAPRDWRPTADEISAAVERAIDHRWVTVVDDRVSPRVRIVAQGRQKMIELLETSISCVDGGLMRAWMSAKLSLIHHLPQPERGRACLELATSYREAIASLGCSECHRASQTAGDDARPCEKVRLQSELAWLDAMAFWRPLQQAAE